MSQIVHAGLNQSNRYPNSRRRAALAAAAAAALLGVVGPLAERQACAAEWTGNGTGGNAGKWGTSAQQAANWTNPTTAPNGVGAVASFISNTTNRAVDVSDTGLSAGVLNFFATTGSGYSLTNNALTLNNTGSNQAQINILTGNTINHSIANNLVLADDLNVNFASTATGALTLSGAISDGGLSYGLTKSGGGVLLLTGTSTFTGPVLVNGGILRLSSTPGTALSDAAVVTLANTAGATLDLTTNETIRGLVGGGTTGGNVTIGLGAVLTVNDTTLFTRTFSGSITGAGGLTKNGSNSTLVLDSTNLSYSGVTTVTDGTLSITNSLLGTGNVSVASIGTLSVGANIAGSVTTAGTLSAASLSGSTLSVTAGTANVSGNVSSGTITASGGTLSVGGSLTAAAGAVTVSGGTLALTGSATPATLNRTSGNINSGTFTVSNDYTNSNFGTGNTFATKGGTTGINPAVTVNNAGTSNQSVTGAAILNGTSATPTLDLGNVRPGATSAFTINYGGDASAPTLRGAIQTGSIGAPFSLTGITSGTGGSYTLANNGTSNQTLNVSSSAGGPMSGTIVLANNFDDVIDQTLSLTGTAYRLATRTATPTSAAFGNVRVGASITPVNITATNTAANDGYSDNLQTSFGTITGAGAAGIIASGGPVTLTPGSSNAAGTLTVSIDTATAGTRTGAVAVNHTSVPTVGGLSSVSLASTSVAVSGGVYRFAVASTAPPTINFGNVREGASVTAQNVTVSNTAAGDGFSDNLQSAFGAVTGAGAAGIITTGGPVTVAGGASNTPGSMTVSISTAAAGTRTGNVAITHTSVPTVSGLTSLALTDTNIAISGGVYRLASASSSPPSIDFGNVRQGASVTPQNVTVSNTAAADGFSDDLQSAFGAVTGAGAAGIVPAGGPVTVAAGASNTPGSLTLSIDTATAGTRAASVPINHTSVPIVSGLTSAPLTSGAVTTAGGVYRYAAGAVTTPTPPNPAAFGIVHVGDSPALHDVVVQNTAASDGFSDDLGASLSATDNPSINLVGGPVTVAPQASSTSGTGGLQLGINTATAGSRDGNVTVAFVSVPTAAGLDTGHSVGSANVPVTGQVNNFAAASVTHNSGAGSLTGGGNTYTLDLGSIIAGGGSASADLALSNVGGISFTDLLNGTFDVTGQGSFTLAGFDTFFSTGGIAGGDARSGLGVTLPDSLAPDTYTGSLIFTPHSTNAAPYDQPLASGNITINLQGVVTSGAPNGLWVDGVGNWSGPTNWSNGTVPNASSMQVKVDNGSATASGVTLDQDATVAQITVDPDDSLTIQATRTLTLAGPASSTLAGVVNNAGTVDVQAGTTTLSGGGTHTGTFSVAGGATLALSGIHNLNPGSNVTGAGTLLVSGGTTTIASPSTHSGPTNVTGGTLVVANGGGLGTAAVSIGTGAAGQLQAGITTAVTLNTLSTAGTGKFDVTNNSMVVKGMSDSAVRALLSSGYNAGGWNGATGIVSTAVTAVTSVGYATQAQLGVTEFKGVNGLTGTDVLVKFTYAGDANLDGKVDIGDLGLLAGAWQAASGKVWFDGDFTYDGAVDIGDLGLLSGNWQKGTAGNPNPPLMDFATAMAQFSAFDGVVVPEPTGVALVGLAGIGLLARRRRQTA